jgi:hypothetical protein
VTAVSTGPVGIRSILADGGSFRSLTEANSEMVGRRQHQSYGHQ